LPRNVEAFDYGARLLSARVVLIQMHFRDVLISAAPLIVQSAILPRPALHRPDMLGD
jgi:hypothetical protein